MAAHEKDKSVEAGSGNVFADLGFEDASELMAKAQLVLVIGAAMEKAGLTQARMAKLIGIDQSKVSKLLRGVTDGFSSDRLLLILNRLDQDVEIVVRPRPLGEQRAARVSVAVAGRE